MGQKLIITEEERNDIRQMYNPQTKRDYVFESTITVDGRYLIFHDEIIDNVLQESLGNIWESIDKFKMIFNNVIIDDINYMTIRENIKSLPIVENNESLYGLRDFILNEGFFEDNWVGKQLYNTATGVTDFVTTSFNGLKKFGVAISQGQWSEIINLLKKGSLYILRKLKDALYSNVGMIVDAILVATVGGKVIQMIPWVLVAGLDAYQIITNNYPPEEQNYPLWSKFLFLGCDILGAVGAGAMAKAAKKSANTLVTAAVKNPSKVIKLLEKMPGLKKTIESMLVNIKKFPDLLKNTISMISKKSPKIGQFLTTVLSKISNIINQFTTSLSTLLNKKMGVNTVGKVSKEGVKTGGILYGIEKGMEKMTNKIIPPVNQDAISIGKQYGYL
jgi:hypothetical protein